MFTNKQHANELLSACDYDGRLLGPLLDQIESTARAEDIALVTGWRNKFKEVGLEGQPLTQESFQKFMKDFIQSADLISETLVIREGVPASANPPRSHAPPRFRYPHRLPWGRVSGACGRANLCAAKLYPACTVERVSHTYLAARLPIRSCS